MKYVVLCLCVLFVFILARVQVAEAAQGRLYVATNGSDSNPGTQRQPFATITHAASVAVAGQTVVVLEGVYHEVVSITESGSTAAPISIVASPGASVVIDGTDSPQNADLVTIVGNHILFQGFEVKNSNSNGIIAWQTEGVSIIGNTVHDAYLSGILVGSPIDGQQRGASHDNAVRQCVVYRTVLQNSARNTTNWPAALAIQTSNRATVSHNKVYDNYGEGIAAYLSMATKIVGNEVFDNYSVNIYLDNAPSAVVDSNFSYSTGDSNYFRSGAPAVGIQAAIEPYAFKLPLTDVVIKNNIVDGTSYGFYYGSYGTGGGMQNSLIANNTFANVVSAAINIDPDRHSGNEFINNIGYRPVSLVQATGSAAGSTFGHNCWYEGSVTPEFKGVGDVTGDPRFLAPSSYTADGYMITVRSVCAASGRALAAVPVDFWGATRPDPTSSGAHQPTP